MVYYTLQQLNLSIRKVILGIGRNFWISAEIASVSKSGFCFMELVQKEGEELLAKNKGIIWPEKMQQLADKYGPDLEGILQSGSKILVEVQISYHLQYGLSLVVQDLDANYTLGELEMRKQATLRQLTSEGFMELQKKLLLQPVLQRLAVVSSAEAAGYGDFLEQLRENPYHYTFQTTLFPVQVQGKRAVADIIWQLGNIAPNQFDGIWIIRGGGSRIDLDAFNDYQLAKAVAQSPLPVFTGLGHQRDEAIADLVAYQANKTPTAAAQWVISYNRSFEEQLLISTKGIRDYGLALLDVAKDSIDDVKINLRHLLDNELKEQKWALEKVNEQIRYRSQNMLQNTGNELTYMAKTIHLLDPETILGRGYTVSLLNGKTISKQNTPKPGDVLQTLAADVLIKSRIEQVEKNAKS